MTQQINTAPVTPVNDDIMNAFSDMQKKNDFAEVLKELFDSDKIYMIGDLTKDEIKLATRIYMIAKMKKIENWEIGLEFLCRLLLSKDRKSRREILHAISGYNQQQSMLQKMNPANWGR